MLIRCVLPPGTRICVPPTIYSAQRFPRPPSPLFILPSKPCLLWPATPPAPFLLSRRRIVYPVTSTTPLSLHMPPGPLLLRTTTSRYACRMRMWRIRPRIIPWRCRWAAIHLRRWRIMLTKSHGALIEPRPACGAVWGAAAAFVVARAVIVLAGATVIPVRRRGVGTSTATSLGIWICRGDTRFAAVAA